MGGLPVVAGSHQRKPAWLRVRPPSGDSYLAIKKTLRDLGLHTVCEEAHCPNVAECWGGGTATIMLLGDTCTRGCRFCNVKTGNPKGAVDPLEPFKVGGVLARSGLSYVVITSVDRDDLADQGSGHFAATIREVKRQSPGMLVEVLIPDFRGDRACIERIVEARPDVIAHNVETVERLQKRVRDPRAGYEQSLSVLRMVKELDPRIATKSSIMLGLGETEAEVLASMRDLRAAGVQILTFGQYLRPSEWHLPVVEYVSPARFDHFRIVGGSMGFAYVASGPLVRSSYRAGEFFVGSMLRGTPQPQSLAVAGGG